MNKQWKFLVAGLFIFTGCGSDEEDLLKKINETLSGSEESSGESSGGESGSDIISSNETTPTIPNESVPDPLTVTSILPNNGLNTGNTTVTITGTGFQASVTITIGGACSNIVVVSSTQVTCKTSANSNGPVDILVSQNSENVTLNGYTYFSILQISPATKTIAVTNSFLVSHSGGYGSVNYSTINGGTLSASTYTAPGSSGTYTVRATDENGNTSDNIVTVNPALSVLPTSYTLAVGNTKSFSASNGVGPYTYSVNNGSINISGLYTAPGSSGSGTITITDSLGNDTTASVTINDALQISPVTNRMGKNTSAYTFSASGGVGSYNYSIFSGGGSISGTDYTPPSTSQTVVIQVTDDIGNTSNSTVTVYDPGVLDTLLDSDGKVTTKLSVNADTIHGIGIQSDGKIVGVGISGNDFGVVRWNSDGSLDTGFDTDGLVVTDFNGQSDQAKAVAIQSDGKIVVVGAANNGVDFDFAVARYNTDGSLDSSFGVSGRVTHDFGDGNDVADGVAIQSDGKIVIVGYTLNGSVYDYGFIRLSTNGGFDSTFDGDGIAIINVSNDDYATDVLIQPDGKILAAGYSFNGVDNDVSLVRLNSNGSLDGTILEDFGRNETATSVGLQSDNKIIVGGTHNFVATDDDFGVVRFDSTGTLDTSFGTSGRVTTDFNSFDYLNDIVIQSNDKIIAVGAHTTNTTFAIIRYSSEGSADTNFGTLGKVTTDFSVEKDAAFAIALDANGDLVVGGRSDTEIGGSTDFDFALTRYWK